MDFTISQLWNERFFLPYARSAMCHKKAAFCEKLVFIDLTSKWVSSLWNNLFLIIAPRILLLACCCGPSGHLFSNVLFSFASGTFNCCVGTCQMKGVKPQSSCAQLQHFLCMNIWVLLFIFWDIMNTLVMQAQCTVQIPFFRFFSSKIFSWLMKFHTPLTSPN